MIIFDLIYYFYYLDLETFDLNKVVPKRRVRPNRANRDIDDEEDDKEYSDEEDNYKGSNI